MNFIAINTADVMSYIGTGIATVITIWVLHWIYRWRNPKCNGVLPPGSMGLPYLGETVQFFRPNPTCDVSPFIKDRVKRYGPIFKTNLIGWPVIAITDPELAYYVLKQEGKLFQSCYPETFTEIFGRQNVGSLHGFVYKYLKTLILRLYGPENLKTVFLSDIEMSCHNTFESWSSQPCFDLKEALSIMIFDITAKRLISYDPAGSVENLRGCFVAFIQGLISFPFDIPGTAYHQCLQGRKRAMKVLKGMLRERMSSADRQCEDFFDLVIAELKKERSLMTEPIALDLMFVLLFASYETTSLTLTLAMKFLSDNPKALQELTEEHEAIIRNRKDLDSGVTWEEYKSMTFTNQVIYESVRLSNIVPVMFRKSLQDVQIRGYTIPKGWSVMLSAPSVHVDPEIYEDPLVFNPWRWKANPEMTGGTKQFMAFGGGLRFCVGADFSRVFMALFLHNFVTKYRFKALRGGNIVRTPGLGFPDGFHIQVFPKE
ncbi:cytochrome P450 family protein [Rhynchospora pubera]|uniref:Cytochrome P450 family protein n=1 Tax=Rhynchospora pubera TaxID=906938 RepID=A0AAV8CVL3_9POAL|nr:cytochrome P450 family protein [Rhynchospora pubera]